MVSNLVHLISQTKLDLLKMKLPKVADAVKPSGHAVLMMDLLKTDYVTLSHFI